MIKENERVESLNIKDYKILQNPSLYCFTSDSVILSKFAKAKKGDVVADVCSGSGIVGLHFYALNENYVKSVTLFELQQSLAEMSDRTIKLNNLQDKFCVVQGKLQDTAENFREKFSLITCNPPYKKVNTGEVNLTKAIALARHEVEITQLEILQKSAYMLKNGGRICICQRVERLLELLNDVASCSLTTSRLQFVSATENGKPYLVLLEAYKGINRQLMVLPNYINK